MSGMSDKRAALRGLTRHSVLDVILRLRCQRRVKNAGTLGLVLLGPVLALGTLLALRPLDAATTTTSLRFILLIDLVYVLVVAALVLNRIAHMISARRAKSAGSRLHLRLAGVFAVIALIPTISVAVFAALTINIGLEGWFSERVGGVVRNSLAAAQAYEEEHRRDLATDARALAGALNRARRNTPLIGDGELRQFLTQGQVSIQRGLREAYVIDSSGTIRARGERSYQFDYEEPSQAQIAQARIDGILIIQDWDNNEFRALIPLGAYLDRLLYVSRNVDGSILNLLDDTQETIQLYQQLESERGRILFEFGLLYLGFAVILILASIWLGLWFAERLSRPVGRLAGAAQRVGSGDLDVQVREESGDDEIAMLGRLFNQMTRQLKGQRNTLLENTRQIEERRRLFDSVLSSITAGVIGLDRDGQVGFANRAAKRLLDLKSDLEIAPLSDVVSEFSPLFERLRSTGEETAQEQVNLVRKTNQEQLLVRMATRRGEDGGLEGYVVAFDDVTDLVSAQRMAAWGDVARRIAHEIKNPLTPIQLSAERIKQKFKGEGIGQYTDVIIRQTGDLRRIVDEFSKFARMPEPRRETEDLVIILRDAATLQAVALADVDIQIDLPEGPIWADIDATMISQAVINLIKNAGEAIDAYTANNSNEKYRGQILLRLVEKGGHVHLTIADNGTGLPQDRARLFEPYVTTRDKGTGLGLPIVRKIIEEHGGTLRLGDAPIFDGCQHKGAQASIRLATTKEPQQLPAESRAAE